MKKEKKTFHLTLKMILFVVIILTAAVGSTVAGSYLNHKTRVDEYYKAITTDISRTVARQLDGDFIEELYHRVNTPEFLALRQQAEDEENEEMIREWLQKEGLWDKFKETWDYVQQFGDDMDVLYLYIESDENEDTMYLIDPDEPLYNTGYVEPSEEEFQDLVGNIHIEPIVTNGEYGWLCSAYDPILNSEGKAIASVGVDIDMNEVKGEQQWFLRTNILYALGFIVVVSIIGILLVRRTVTRPLEKLTAGLRKFSPREDGNREKSHVLTYRSQGNDEIAELCDDVRSMQNRIVDTLCNLTNVTAEKERIGAELNVATQIQADMLPRIFPAFPDRSEFDIYATMTPAKEVGGDFYDFFLIDHDHLGMVMADVSGKGVPAALFMVITKTLIKNRAMMGDSPAKILANVNEQLCEGNEAELFVTVWLAVLEISTGKGMAANAGHEHPAIRRKNGQYELDIYRHSPAVATLEGIRFREHAFELHPGDALFVYTDGVPEATNSRNELFGTDRMLEVLNGHSSDSPEELLPLMKEQIDRFVGDAAQFDDITMMCLEYRGPEREEEPGEAELAIEARTDRLPEVLEFVDRQLTEAGCPSDIQFQIDVAVEEIFVNIASYAYGGKAGPAVIRFRTGEDPGTVVITLIDSGKPFNPLKKQDPDITLSAEERAIGGLGIFMVRKSMDSVEYAYENGHNMLTLRKSRS